MPMHLQSNIFLGFIFIDAENVSDDVEFDPLIFGQESEDEQSVEVSHNLFSQKMLHSSISFNTKVKVSRRIFVQVFVVRSNLCFLLYMNM